MGIRVIILLLLAPLWIFAQLSGEIDTTKPLLKLTLIDVWQGDSILLELPSGKTTLIDAGMGFSEYQKFDAGASKVIPLLIKNKIHQIDYMVWTHPHNDHIGGIPAVIEKFKVGTVYDCGMAYTTETYIKCLTLVDQKKIKYETVKAGDKLDWDPKLEVTVLHPGEDLSDNPNDNSVVLKITYGKVSFLLEGDAEETAEAEIMKRGFNLRSSIIKIAHHGSATSTSDEFIDSVKPEVAIISVGRNNKFGHPAAQTLSKLADRNINILRTDKNGNIMVITDGNKYKINCEKKI